MAGVVAWIIAHNINLAVVVGGVVWVFRGMAAGFRQFVVWC